MAETEKKPGEIDDLEEEEEGTEPEETEEEEEAEPEEEGGEEGEEEEPEESEEGEEEEHEGEEEEEEATTPEERRRRENETLEEKRARRAQERRNKRLQQKQAKIRDKLTIQRLEAKIANLEKGQVGIATHQVQSNIREVNTKIQNLQNTLAFYKNAKKTALNEGKKDEAERLDDLIYNSRKDLEAHEQWKEKFSAAVAARGGIPTPEEAANPGDTTGAAPRRVDVKNDPNVRKMAASWATQSGYAKWSPEEREQAGLRDAEIFNEGVYDPRAPEYYKELNRRLKEDLPERYQAKSNTPPPKKKNRSLPKVTGGAGKRSSGGDNDGDGPKNDPGRGIPEATKKFWRSEGMWGDVKQRQRMADNYWAEAAKQGVKRPR